MHTPQPEPGILAFDLLRGRGFAGGALSSNYVANAGNLVNLAFNIIASPVAVKQRASQHVDRQDVDAALQPAFLRERHPFVDRDQRVVVALGQEPLQRRLAGIVNAADPQRLNQSVNTVRQNIQLVCLVLVNHKVRHRNKAVAGGGAVQGLRAGKELVKL